MIEIPNQALVLAGNWETKEPIPDLSIESKIRTRALGLLASRGVIDQAVLVGGLRVLNDTIAESDGMEDLLQDEFGLSKLLVIKNDDCHDTRSSAVSTKSLLPEWTKTPKTLITSKTHMPRSVKTFESEGFNVVPVIAENVLLDSGDDKYIKMANDYLSSLRYRKWQTLELGMRAVLTLDRNGKLSQRAAGLLRSGEYETN